MNEIHKYIFKRTFLRKNVKGEEVAIPPCVLIKWFLDKEFLCPLIDLNTGFLIYETTFRCLSAML